MLNGKSDNQMVDMGVPPHFRETPMKFAGTERISSNFPKNCMSG
jgi:hypothetical protein